MKVAIQMCSYSKDIVWARYALRSIQKFATGFSGVTMVIPDRDKAIFTDLPIPVTIRTYKVSPAKPKLHYLIQQCRADEHNPAADFVLHMDSDCMFIEPVTPADYFVGDKPILLREKFAVIQQYWPQRCKWKAIVEKALGFPVEYETMVRHPSVHPRWIYSQVRQHITNYQKIPFDSYVFKCSETPLGFTEYPTIGAYALRSYPNFYHWIDAKSPHSSFDMEKAVGVTEKMRQFWSHESISKTQAEMEAILA